MRIAFLIVAHNEPGLLGRLVKRLDFDGAHSFIHISANIDEAPFRDACEGAGNVSFIERSRRVVVAWGGFSIAGAILNLAEMAMADARGFDRYIVLSGVDYPIRSSSEMRAALNSPHEFMRVDRALDPHGDGIHDWYIRRRFWGDNALLNPRDAPLKFVAIAAKAIARLAPLPPYPGGGKVYHGAAFFALTGECMNAIIAYYKSCPAALRWFRQVRSPVELIFQTAAKATSFDTAITCDRTVRTAEEDSVDETVHGVHYIDWSAGGPHPRDLIIDDYDKIVASPAIFLRKTSSKVSLPLLDKLDRRIAGAS